MQHGRSTTCIKAGRWLGEKRLPVQIRWNLFKVKRHSNLHQKYFILSRIKSYPRHQTWCTLSPIWVWLTGRGHLTIVERKTLWYEDHRVNIVSKLIFKVYQSGAVTLVLQNRKLIQPHHHTQLYLTQVQHRSVRALYQGGLSVKSLSLWGPYMNH